jgi:glyoxylase-like metal-dependent hydrolase (beta-lactamase superfamily II)
LRTLDIREVGNCLLAPFFHEATATFTHVLWARDSRAALIIDSVADYDSRSGSLSHESAEQLIAFIQERGLRLERILDTHIHADHVTAAAFLRDRLGGRIGMSRAIVAVRDHFSPLLDIPETESILHQVDDLFDDGDCFDLGGQSVDVLHVPGHTPADLCFRVADAIFVGDTIFMPDVGTARCDFPGGDATRLHAGIRRLLSHPDQTRLFLCHDYPPAGGDRDICAEVSVGTQRHSNIHARDDIDQASFVRLRQSRDQGLDLPALIIPSLQFNLRAGRLPEAQANGVSYLKVPINAFGKRG